GCIVSAKKDGLANIGGFLALNDDALAEKCRNLLILTEGFPTYGGLAGYDMEAIATGLEEVVDEAYLEHRVASVQAFGRRLTDARIPIMLPTGGHGVFIDAAALLPHIPAKELPGIALVNALYVAAGVRSSEIGSVMFGRHASLELVRLAIPRRLYTDAQLRYAADAVVDVAHRAESLHGYRITYEPRFLRHFTARFEPLEADVLATFALSSDATSIAIRSWCDAPSSVQCVSRTTAFSGPAPMLSIITLIERF